ncbi:cell wall mannoprotein 1 family protein [Aspergillus tanneri]|uniref:Uncharacterized protein n=1 Tax=Aspergillus tanneri TaxID=1220188 RepID=A0A5M9MKY4_9EURO|nr:uncharacterized protein ATNIH1004_009302 [Aspergillus tanneri]KAA8645089.1 hypothetical protein ATNIH1004_009302 [Aspergillus tanneri]
MAVSLADVATIMSQLQSLQKQVESYDSAIGKYDGSYMSMLPIATGSFKMHQAAREARKAIEDSDTISEADASQLIGQAEDVDQAIHRTLDTTASKDKIADDNGFKQVGALMLTHFQNEQRAFHEVLNGKLPNSSREKVKGTMKQAADKFDVVLRRYA